MNPVKRNPIPLPREVSPAALRAAIGAAQAGDPAQYYAVLEFFRRQDEEIPGALRSLIDAVLQEEPVIRQTDDSAESLRQRGALQLVLDGLDITGLMEHLLRGHYYGLSSVWMEWDMLNGMQAPVTYETIPFHYYHAKKDTGSQTRILHIADQPYHAYDREAILLYSPEKPESFTDFDFTNYGCGLAAVRFALFSWYNHSDWGAYNEVFATPLVLGTLLQGWGDTDKELLTQAVFGIGSDAKGIITDKSKIDFVETKNSGADVFAKADEIWRIARARIIKSESLTDNMGSHGSNAAMLTVNGIRLDVARAMARRLERILNRRLVRPFLEKNFKTPLVSLSLPVRHIQNLIEQVQIDQALNRIGLPLSRSQLYETYNRRPPNDDADTLAINTFNPFGGL